MAAQPSGLALATERSRAASRAWERFTVAERTAADLAQRYLDPTANGRPSSPPPSLADVAAAFRRAAQYEAAHELACAKARQGA